MEAFESKINAAPEAVPMQEIAPEEEEEVTSLEKANEGSWFHSIRGQHLTSLLCRHKYCVGIVAVLVTTIIVFIIVWQHQVSNRNLTQVPSSCVDASVLPDPVCPKDWIGYEGKCYFFSEEKGNWTFSQNFCSSYNATMAVIQNEAEKIFILRYMGGIGHWIGLQKELDQTWKWVDGREVNDLLELRGEGDDCAYLSRGYAIVSPCYIARYWICSQLDAYRRAYVREEANWMPTEELMQGRKPTGCLQKSLCKGG